MKQNETNLNSTNNNVFLLENSINSKQNTKSAKSKTFQSKSPNKPVPTKIDELNDWNFCNPSNFDDPLPQPFRFIDKILNDTILSNVYEKVYEIEKYKLDPNYEGKVKEIKASGAPGSFEFDGISALGWESNGLANHLIVGDSNGFIYILHMSKRTQVSKFEVSLGKRILNIAVNTLKIDDNCITTFAVICRGEPNIHIYRYKIGENKVFKHFLINYNKKLNLPNIDKNSKISNWPYEMKFSHDGKFLGVNLYDGSIEVFHIPECNIPIQNQNSTTQPTNKPAQIEVFPQKQYSISFLDINVTEIVEPFYIINLRNIPKIKTYDDFLNSYLQNDKIKIEELNEKNDKTKTIGKNNNPIDVKKGKQNVVIEPQKEESEFEINKIQILGEIIHNDKNYDISPLHEIPYLRGEFHFISESICILDEYKTFNKFKEYRVVKGIAVAWLHTNYTDIHVFQNVCLENVPKYFFPKQEITDDPIIKISDIKKTANNNINPTKQTDPKQIPVQNNIIETPIFEKKLLKSFETLYKISSSSINKSCSFLVVGLEDGSVVVLDLLLSYERCYLDKHKSEVKFIRFNDEWTVTTGSNDGSIHIYNIKNENLQMKRTNIFRSQKSISIVGLEASENGLILAIDNLYNARVYDAFHNEKIMKLMPSQVMEEEKKNWCLFPKPLICVQKKQICLLVNVIPKTINSIDYNENTYEKQTKLLLYRVHDNLLNIFPGLSNLSRMGIPKDEVRNAFSKLDWISLMNAKFEIHVLNEKGQKGNSRPNLTVISEHENYNSKSNYIKTNTKNLKQNNKKFDKNENDSMIFSKIIRSKESEMSSIDLNSSFKTYSNLNTKKDLKSAKYIENSGLTKEALHPEDVLKKKKMEAGFSLHNVLKEAVLETRNRAKNKELRLEKIDKISAKITSDLAIREDLNRLEQKKKNLQENIKKHTK